MKTDVQGSSYSYKSLAFVQICFKQLFSPKKETSWLFDLYNILCGDYSPAPDPVDEVLLILKLLIEIHPLLEHSVILLQSIIPPVGTPENL